MTVLRILCIDDHQVVRHGVRRMFDDRKIPIELGEASTPAEATSLASRQDWDIAILDISLAGKSGLDVLRGIKQLRPRLPILMFSMHSEEVYARRSISAGAQGYITKGSSSEQLFEAINKVAKGGRYLAPELAEKIVFTADAEKLPHETLSDREFQILLMIAKGKSNKEISQELNIDSRTVTTHRRRILDKMNMSVDSELNEYARVNRLLE